MCLGLKSIFMQLDFLVCSLVQVNMILMEFGV